MKLFASLLATFAFATPLTHAAITQFDLGSEYTGGTAPVGSPAWLRATVDDGGSSGSVTLKIEALNLTGSEFVTKFHMNLDPSISTAGLTTSAPVKVGTFANPNVSFSTNAFNAGASASFDLEVLFDNSPPSNRFGAGESVTMTISGSPLLNAQSFSFLSVSPALPISAHIQGIGANGNFSGWITTAVPEPTSLIGIALAVSSTRRRP